MKNKATDLGPWFAKKEELSCSYEVRLSPLYDPTYFEEDCEEAKKEHSRHLIRQLKKINSMAEALGINIEYYEKYGERYYCFIPSNNPGHLTYTLRRKD